MRSVYEIGQESFLGIQTKEYSVDFQLLVIVLIASTLVGAAFGYGVYRFIAHMIRTVAQDEAKEILDDARAELADVEAEIKVRTQEIEDEMWQKAQKELELAEDKVASLESKAEDLKNQFDNAIKNLRKKLSEKQSSLDSRRHFAEQAQKNLEAKRNLLSHSSQTLISELGTRTGLSVQEVKEDISRSFLQKIKKDSEVEARLYEEEIKDNAEYFAKQILTTTFDRFARAYCSERGLGAVEFVDPSQKAAFAIPEFIKRVEELCGCDLIVENDNSVIGVSGFDPVRRELTRRLLEKISRTKRIDLVFIDRTFADLKKDLLKQIKGDGEALAKEMRISDFDPEIKQMLGSLRYRYSFTQNQYFHVAEVGWLGGLLASELEVDIKKARRAGVLHDIGKAMDHAREGGHAILGADFIQQKGEAPDIVHAVRAHHYDTQPNTVLDFLTIAADAISGARPGARRSTVETYNQKVTELENIAMSFDGVEDCFILNGGREVRVISNGKKIDDAKAVELSQKIATRIENECSYPGSIKVVIVRSTTASETTRGY